MFSNHETTGGILSESIAVGLPILTSCVGIAPQIVTEEIGRIVKPDDEHQLTEMMDWMIDHIETFDKATIRTHG